MVNSSMNLYNEYVQVIKICDDLIRDYYRHNCRTPVDIIRVKQLRAEAVKDLRML